MSSKKEGVVEEFNKCSSLFETVIFVSVPVMPSDLGL